MKKIRKALFFCVIILATGTVSAQVNQGELEGSLAPVTFFNYEGPQARIESREQIRQIGVPLGQAIRSGAARTGATNRYFVIHSVSDPDGDKLDADIFGLGANVGVDHVRNLRLIIQGYLQEAYSYSERDAALLAQYITVYNAVYRGNWNYFSGRYKNAVLGNLNPQQAGLSVRYAEWPGRTLMLIPLGSGGLSSVDTSVISDGRVVDELRKDDDRGIEQRKNMVDLKEREAEAAEQKAAEQREAAIAAEKALTDEKARLEQEQRQNAEDRRRLEEDKAAGTLTQEEAQQREDELARRESDVDKKSDELAQQESDLDAQQKEAERQEQFAEQKAEEARRDRENIAQDQQSIINQGEVLPGLVGITIERGNSGFGRLVSFDPATGQQRRRSQLDTVYTRTLTFINGKVIAIAGENRGNSAVRLIEINPRSLEMEKQGEDNIHSGSLIWVNGSDIYAITAGTAGTYNLGRFGVDLVLRAKSKVNIHPNAAVSIQQGKLLTQKSDGSAVILNPQDLSE